MESRTINMLEFPKVLQHLSSEAVSEPGKHACLNTSIIHNPEDLDKELHLLKEIIACYEENRLTLNSFPDISPHLIEIERSGTVLDIESLWDIAAFLNEAEGYFNTLQGIDPARYQILHSMNSELAWPNKIVSALKRCIGSTGEIRDDSSPGLYSAREEIRTIRQQCAKKVDESLTLSNISHYLQDEYLTISSDRYVLALKANFKGRIQGIIHDYSQTGETCYFEPFFLTELNNKLQKLKRREREELLAVLRYLTELCKQSLEELKTILNWLTRMDYILAKARFSHVLQAVPLDISESGVLRLKNIRHPLLVLGGYSAVPMDIELKEGQRVLVISGGNAGGKTVCLKTLGLAALMALCALPVPAEQGSSIPRWDKVFVSMVSEQSVEESFSTFTAQIDHFSRFWPMTDAKSLVILDEFGVGTDPSQGAALAQAVVDKLLERKAWVATATHFPALKAYALSKDEVRAASVLFDEETRKPLYRMGYDQVGASLALDMAREQGLPDEIISRARQYLLMDGQDRDDIFAKLNTLAVQREKELERLRQKERMLKEKFEKKTSELVRQKQALSSEIKAASQDILSQWKKQKIGRKKALRELASLRGKVENQEDDRHVSPGRPLSWNSIVPGHKYLYTPWNKTGIVQEKDEKKKQVKIDLGGISLWVDLSVLDECTGDASGKVMNSPVSTPEVRVPIKVDIRGQYAREALLELDQYLDQAILAGRKNLEVVHGKGTGALRLAVHEYLRDNPAVARFKCSSEMSGGEGMTEVELK